MCITKRMEIDAFYSHYSHILPYAPDGSTAEQQTEEKIQRSQAHLDFLVQSENLCTDRHSALVLTY